MVYTAGAIMRHPEVGLTRGGFSLFAMLVKGDYDKGVRDVGKGIIYRRQPPSADTLAIQRQLRIAHQFSYPSLSLPPDFPDMQILENYINPTCSAWKGSLGGGKMRDSGEPNLVRAAAFCEEKFGEWGHRTAIIKRFRSLMWEAAVMRVLRRSALEIDNKERAKSLAHDDSSIIKGRLTLSPAETVGTPAYLVKHPSFEGRDLQPVELAQPGIKGMRHEPTGNSTAFDDDLIAGSSQATKEIPKRLPPDPHSNMRVWIPVSIVRQVYPGLVGDCEAEQEKSVQKAPGSNGHEDERGVKHGLAQVSRIREATLDLLLSQFGQIQGIPIPEFCPDHEGSHAELQSQSRIEDGTLSHSSGSANAPRLDVHPSQGGFLFTMPNPDDHMELKLEDEEDASETPRSRLGLFNQAVGFSSGESSLTQNDNVRLEKQVGKRPVDRSAAASILAPELDERERPNVRNVAQKRGIETFSIRSHSLKSSPPTLRKVSHSRVQLRFDRHVLEVFSDSEEEEIAEAALYHHYSEAFKLLSPCCTRTKEAELSSTFSPGDRAGLGRH
ncbi:hypothetical protein AZE42_01832 [Rhizopogon vesiculosus]|uniref:Holliday junction resolvase Gen1 C-terminal domain-containing protein n=1 Tax=Rhizopogon vesiculosus TaxID=180088 RepID=A0A1J8PNW0_9AGAM|nr:hypothetical protein AZE42_01832 [Rhizopogon vesiculosus]